MAAVLHKVVSNIEVVFPLVDFSQDYVYSGDFPDSSFTPVD